MPITYSTLPDKDSLAQNPLGFAKDVYITFLRDFFSKFPKGEFRYSGEDATESELTITDAASIEKSVIEKRPAIVVQRGVAAWGNIALDQFRTQDMKTGRRIHTDLLSSTMTILCISRQGLEAERLAYQVSFALKSHRRELQRRGIHETGREGNIGSESPPGSIVAGDVDAHTVSVPVYSPFYLQITWEDKPVIEKKFRGAEIILSPKSVVSYRNAAGIRKRVVDLDGVAQRVKISG